jgi:hypothetical protein
MPLPACPLLRFPFFLLWHILILGPGCALPPVHLQIRREWIARTDSQGIRQAELEASRELCVQDPRGSELPAPERRRALRPQGGQHPHDENRQRGAVRLWSLA